MQQKMMKYMMIFMAFMFYKVPSGLGIYFITSSLWQIGERLLLPKVTHAAAAVGGPGDDGKAAPAGRRRQRRRRPAAATARPGQAPGQVRPVLGEGPRGGRQEPDLPQPRPSEKDRDDARTATATGEPRPRPEASPGRGQAADA